MAGGVVSSTQEGIDAIQRMKNILNGEMQAQIQEFMRNGDILQPGVWDGAHADAFRGEWGPVKTSLQNALTKLNEISDNIMTVNTNIQGAGGNQ